MVSMRRLTTREVAKKWGMKPRTVSRWCREGVIAAEKWGRVWRITEEEVQRVEDKHATQ